MMLVLPVALGLASPAQAATLTVTTTADSIDAAGSCSAVTLAALPGPDGQTSLREAVCASNSNPGGDSIAFSVNGTFTLSGAANDDNGGTGDLDIKQSLSINGNGAANTILDGGGIERIFDVFPSAASTFFVTSLTLQNGDTRTTAFKEGGAMYLHNNVTATFGICRIINNFSGSNGAIENRGALTIISSELSGNQTIPSAGSAAGGGIHNQGSLVVSYTTITNNLVRGEGGGIATAASVGATVTINNSTISGNTASITGGGLGNGGGISTTGNQSTINITNSTISGNYADNSGGGLYLVTPGGGTGNATLESVTLTNNTADFDNNGAGAGGGVAQNTANLTIQNTIVAGNFNSVSSVRDDISGSAQAVSAYNLVGDGTGLAGISNGVNNNQIGSGATPLNALLAPLAANGGATQTHALLAASPARDTGNSSENIDQRSLARPFGVADDIGALELATPTGPEYVVSVLEDTDDGNYAANDLSLREAINFANTDGTDSTITFAPAVFTAPRKTITLGGTTLSITANGSLTITGPSAGVNIDANSASGVFQITSATVELIGLTITNGETADGGGVDSVNGNVTLTGCTISGNNATGSGGGINCTGGSLTMNNCTVSGNTAVAAGGIYVNITTLVIDRSTISNNTAATYAGGLASINSSAVLNNCTISGNRANGSTIGSGGGALDMFTGGSMVLTSCTVTGNSAPNFAGGARGGIWLEDGTFEIRNSIVAGNTTQDFQRNGGTFINSGYNLIGNNTSVTGAFGAGLPNGTDSVGTAASPLDPKLGPLQNNGGPTATHAPLYGSVAIHNGNNVAGLTTDQRGSTRFVGPAPDIGAVEILTFYSLSGYTRTNSLAPIGGVSVQVGTTSGPSGTPVISDSNGYYQVANVPPGAYFLTPALAGWTFSPTTQGLLVSTAPRGANFVGTRIAANYSVSGRVSDGAGIAMPGISIALAPAAGGVATPILTNSAGYFTFSNVPDGAYTLTPNKAGTTFAPASKGVTVSGGNISGQNFIGATGYNLSGRVYRSNGSAIVGVTVTSDTGQTAVTNGAGYYTMRNVPLGDRTLTPSLAAFNFAPIFRSVTVGAADQTGINFLGAGP